MNFRERDQIAEAVSSVMEATQGYVRGDVIQIQLIEEAAGIDKYTAFWGTLIKKLKRAFEREKRITLWAVPGVGYKLLTVEEQAKTAPCKRSRRAERQLLKAIGHLEALPNEELSEHQQSSRAAQLEKLARNRRQMRHDRRLANALGKPTESVHHDVDKE